MGDSLEEIIVKFNGIEEKRQSKIIIEFSNAFKSEKERTIKELLAEVNMNYPELGWDIYIPNNKNFNTNNGKEEKALDNLFSKFSSNKDYSEVLVKVIMINNLYSTRLNNNQKGKTISVKAMAQRITDIGDVINSIEPEEAIEIIGGNSIYKDYNKAYSFASKYLSFTYRNAEKKEDLIPITDSLSRKTLKFMKYANKRINLECYSNFYEAMNELSEQYNIGFKELDAFLWLIGKAF